MNTKPRISAHLANTNLKLLKNVLTQDHIDVQKILLCKNQKILDPKKVTEEVT
ncbi:hypothetical protein INT48_005311, partial [Thamnidium elegans]